MAGFLLYLAVAGCEVYGMPRLFTAGLIAAVLGAGYMLVLCAESIATLVGVGDE